MQLYRHLTSRKSEPSYSEDFMAFGASQFRLYRAPRDYRPVPWRSQNHSAISVQNRFFRRLRFVFRPLAKIPFPVYEHAVFRFRFFRN